MAKETIRIGNAGGYWGDDPSALERQVRGGHLDYITMDFLAEITMSILQKQQSRNPELGYAKDLLTMLRPIMGDLLKNKTTLITNAGGINPIGCAKAIHKLGEELGFAPKIAVVYGDDILDRVDSFRAKGIDFKNMESDETIDGIADKLQSANIYFGAAPVVEALKWNPDIVITGRVTDTGITLAAMIHEFAWSLQDWDKLAHGIVAGHIMECGTQATGGNFTDWEQVPSFDQVGFPIVEVSKDGSFLVTKHPNSGGMVSVDTVREQLFYEMGNPADYITPDVIADFTSIQLEQHSESEVRVSGIKGREPTELYKVSMAYQDGYKAIGSIIISGPRARNKAETFSKIFWARLGDDFEETSTEYVGWNSCHRSLVGKEDGNEILLRLGARAKTEESIRTFGKLVPSLILSGPPGVAVLGGVPKAQNVVSYWPALMPKSVCQPQIALLEGLQIVEEREVNSTQLGTSQAVTPASQTANQANQEISYMINEFTDGIPLEKLCLARSGDKGDMVNIGVLARSEESFQFLEEFLTAQRVKNYFQELCHGTVTRYTLKNMLGFNFLLDQSLGGGGTKTLRIDAQGKTFAQALLAQKAPNQSSQ